VPEGYEPQDPKNVRALAEGGEIGIPIKPGTYAKEIAEEFVERLRGNEWDAAALVFDIPESYARIHHEKIDVQLRNLIVAKGAGISRDDWFYVPAGFEALYMTYLARRISEQNNLQLLSDSPAAWTGSTYFKYDGEIEMDGYGRDDLAYQLVNLVIRDFIPENILDIRPEVILNFREKYRPQRQRFVHALQTTAKTLSDCEDDSVFQDRISDLKREIEESLKEFRESQREINIVGWTGMKSLSFPVITQIAQHLAGKTLDATASIALTALGMGMGLISGFSDLLEKRRKLEKACDFSYLIHVDRELWANGPDFGYNKVLWQMMEEFIND